jgi:hypothetical protein
MTAGPDLLERLDAVIRQLAAIKTEIAGVRTSRRRDVSTGQWRRRIAAHPTARCVGSFLGILMRLPWFASNSIPVSIVAFPIARLSPFRGS